MIAKYPIAYELQPLTFPRPDVYWFTLNLTNIGDEALSDLAIELNSLDTACIRVLGTGTYLSRLRPNEEATHHIQASVRGSGDVYVQIDGRKASESFLWEAPGARIQVGGQPAELLSFLATREPRARLGEPITCEAKVRGLVPSISLVIEFWANTPAGELRSLAKEGIGELPAGEEAVFSVQITPEREGLYVLHAYLYQDARRVDHLTEHLSISL